MFKEYTICKKHGKQPAIGNWNECEACLIEYKSEQMEKEFGMGFEHKPISEIRRNRKVLSTTITGEF